MALSKGEQDLFPSCRFRIAVTGKGGVGKTIIAAMIGRYLRERRKKVLLVDADPAMGLAYILGADTAKSIGRYSEYLNNNPKAKRELEEARIKDVLIRESLLELDELTSMLIMGKDEGPGCFCGINDLLKYGIGAIAMDYDLMVIDCEAGLEQVKRRVLHSVNILFIVSDMTARGLKTARQIWEIIARNDADVIFPEKVSLIINRHKGDEDFLLKAQQEVGIDLLATLPEDENIAKLDMEGKTINELPANAPSFACVRTMLDALDI